MYLRHQLEFSAPSTIQDTRTAVLPCRVTFAYLCTMAVRLLSSQSAFCEEAITYGPSGVHSQPPRRWLLHFAY